MLHLVERNKAGRNLHSDDVDEINWRSLFRSSEDSFTSSVFSLLTYLPPEEFWNIISDSLNYKPDLPKSGTFLGVEFWPKWKHDGRRYCEPDVFIRFSNFDLIIEAKRFDHTPQSSIQWEAELRSYFKEYAEEDKIVIFLAVGGVNEMNKFAPLSGFENKRVTIIKCRWRSLLEVVNKELRNSIVEKANSIYSAKTNILKDIILSFRIHGFQTGLLFDSMPLNNSVNLNLVPSLKMIKPLNLTLSDLKINSFSKFIKIL